MSAAFGIWAMLCATVGIGCETDPNAQPAPEEVLLQKAADGTIALTSGMVVRLHETLLQPEGVPTHLVKTVRLRYVSDGLSQEGGFTFEDVEGDFAHLCVSFGLPTRAQSAPNAEQIIISMASRETAFGETTPDVAQFIDSFAVREDACIWDGL